MIFLLLGRQDEQGTPSRARVNKLLDAGLGKALLSMKKNATHNDLASKLEQNVPKLKTAGGFEVLRAHGGGAGHRKSSLVHPGAFGYTAPHLKDRLGQAVAYLRPLQADLDEEPVKTEVKVDGFCWQVFHLFSIVNVMLCMSCVGWTLSKG